ncbi:MAG: hypothetical protein M3Y33_01955 [Actinomycetota bacterium]|nr:hypothetical protein [Actinomycetota bacterium]
MDGRQVGAAIRQQVRPVLKAAGFGEFTDRKAWRQSDHTIDHVAFRSFNSYIAAGVGCTSFSFSVEAGVCFRCLDPGLRRPQAQHLTFRSVLGKNLRQPVFHPYGRQEATDRPDVWYVAPDGQNLDDVVDDAVVSLRQLGLPFIERYGDPLRAFSSLLSERAKDADFGAASVMMPGNPGSPRWHQTALAIGHLILADPRPRINAAPTLQDR